MTKRVRRILIRLLNMPNKLDISKRIFLCCREIFLKSANSVGVITR